MEAITLPLLWIDKTYHECIHTIHQTARADSNEEFLYSLLLLTIEWAYSVIVLFLFLFQNATATTSSISSNSSSGNDQTDDSMTLEPTFVAE
jgi:hypothetical protein